ncbi:MAG: hypothetical protein ACKO3W_16125 [bacterium]
MPSDSSSMPVPAGRADSPEDGRASRVVRVVNFEDCGDCTLLRLAGDARAGDDVVVLGPQTVVDRLVELGLREDVRVHRIGRFVGRWRKRDLTQLLRSLDAGWTGARQTSLYARHAFDRRIAGDDATHLAGVPTELPRLPDRREGQRDRIRRELGLARHDFALLVAGDPSAWIDIGLVARAAGMAHVALAGSGVRLRIVASPEVPRLAERSQFLVDAVDAPPIVVDRRADRPWLLIGAVDALVVDQDGLATDPVSCAGQRCAASQALGPVAVSPLPALWSLAAGIPTVVHRTVDLGSHADGPSGALVRRFEDDVAMLSRIFHDLARSASAASR